MKKLIILWIILSSTTQTMVDQDNSKHLLFDKAQLEMFKDIDIKKDLEKNKELYDRISKSRIDDLIKYCKSDIFKKSSSRKCTSLSYTLLSLYFEKKEDLETAINALDKLPHGGYEGATVVIPKNEKISNSNVLIKYTDHELLLVFDKDYMNTDPFLKQFQKLQGTGVIELNKKY